MLYSSRKMDFDLSLKKVCFILVCLLLCLRVEPFRAMESGLTEGQLIEKIDEYLSLSHFSRWLFSSKAGFSPIVYYRFDNKWLIKMDTWIPPCTLG